MRNFYSLWFLSIALYTIALIYLIFNFELNSETLIGCIFLILAGIPYGVLGYQIWKSFKQELIKKWTEENWGLGEMLGYPDCCIKEFCDQPPQLMKGNPSTQDRLRYKSACIDGDFTGFIPCSKHAKQIEQGERDLESLIDSERRSSEFFPPFPIYGNHNYDTAKTP